MARDELYLELPVAEPDTPVSVIELTVT